MSLNEQLVELQIRLAYQEDLINQLNDVVAKQDNELLLIKHQLKLMVKRIEELSATPSAGAVADLNERPPHY